MKVVGLFLALGIIAMMCVMLTTMSANASVQASLAKTIPLVNMDSAAPANSVTMESTMGVTEQKTRLDSQDLSAVSPRKNTRKRAINRCARITATCWGTS